MPFAPKSPLERIASELKKRMKSAEKALNKTLRARMAKEERIGIVKRNRPRTKALLERSKKTPKKRRLMAGENGAEDQPGIGAQA